MMHYKQSIYIAVFLVSLAIPFCVQAETLQQAWDIALEVDHSLKAVEENRAEALQQLEAAKSVRLPSLSIGAGYTVLDDGPTAKTSFGGTDIELPLAEKQSSSYQATVRLPIYTSGRISSGIKAANSLLKVSHSQLSASRLYLKLKVAETFVGVLRATRGLEVARSHVESLWAHERDVWNFYQQGMVSRNDLLAAQVALADAEQSTIKAENRLDIAKSAYNRFLNRPLSHSVSLDEIQSEITYESVERLTEQALAQRHELQALREQIEALLHQAKAVQAQTAPQIGFIGGYGFQENRYQVHEGQWHASLGVQWQLFDGGSKHKASAIRRQAAKVQEQHDDLATKVALQVRQYWLDSQETLKRIVVTEKTIEQAKENLRVNRDRYENGLSTNTEVLNAETLRTGSEDNHANALYDAVLATLRLKWSLGEL